VARQKYRRSERQARRTVGQPRGTQRYIPALKPDEDGLTRNVIELASEINMVLQLL
jgi:putative transposase